MKCLHIDGKKDALSFQIHEAEEYFTTKTKSNYKIHEKV